MVEIDGPRLLTGLEMLRSFGATGTGVVRPTFSDADIDARRWLCRQMDDAGLDATVDGMGNVFGRSPNPGPALVIGSHSDTQPEGGWLDGALGVMYGIEVARALLVDPSTSHLAIDAVAWSDEESTYSSCLGSRSFVRDLPADVLEHQNASGETVGAARDRVGRTNTDVVHFEPDRHVGYLEAHIEQGPNLEEADLLVGVVTSIVGIRGLHVEFSGEQNHAGTTPMARRRDAGQAMFAYAAALDDRVRGVAGPTSVWTVGTARLEPGAASIIPGRASLGIQFRDPSDAILDAIEDAMRGLASEMSGERGVRIDVEAVRSPISPTVMDDALRAHLVAAADSRVPGNWLEMPSAAGHDPMVLADHLPCAMLFIPSIGGLSHTFAEDSHHDHIVTGCRVLADAAASILLAT
ncbi:MAG: hydantoinase/carbamoylase family amidase [Acidimicrobiales bacterium]